MKNQTIIIFISLSILITSFSGCTDQENNKDKSLEDISVNTKAQKYVENLTKNNYETVYQHFTSEVKEKLPLEDLQYAWESLINRYGSFEEIVKTKQKEEQGYQVVYVTCSFSTVGFLDLRFVFNNQDQIAGFQFVPTEPTEQYSSPNYVNHSSFTEKNITFGLPSWKLPATISIPIGTGPFPAVVLVHGSGPNDRDETIGPNKPFKDIAQGLASNGIIVLRYDKRTYVYPEKSASLTNVTPQDELITDALAAVTYLKNVSKVNQSQLYLLGHSLGAMMAPEIASQSNNLSGVIMLAAPARSFEDLYLAQITYLAKLDGTIDEIEEKQIKETEKSVQKIKNLSISKTENVLNLPRSYWEYLSTYDAVETAQTLHIPFLILQGKRDYQVTFEDDFKIWQQTFENSTNGTIRSYDSLNHLFISGSGQPSNEEYLSAGNVAKTVIIDIASWIKNQ
jgi:hypothetical protein